MVNTKRFKIYFYKLKNLYYFNYKNKNIYFKNTLGSCPRMK